MFKISSVVKHLGKLDHGVKEPLKTFLTRWLTVAIVTLLKISDTL